MSKDILNRSAVAELVKKGGKPFIGTSAPEGAAIGSLWLVQDPVLLEQGDKAPVALRCLLPFNEAAALVQGMSVDKKELPKVPVWTTVQYGRGSEELRDAVPDFDPDFRPGFEHLFKILQILNNRNAPGRGEGYYAFGEAGTGKTSTVLWVHALLGLPLVQFNCNEQSDVSDLFVRQAPGKDGKWKTLVEAALRAVRHQWSVLIDEIDLAPSALPPALNDLIEGHSYSVPGYDLPSVRAEGGFHLFSTGNTGFSACEAGQYNGRTPLDESFRSRCLGDYYGEPDEATIKSMIAAHYGEALDDSLKGAIANFAVNLSQSWKSNGVPMTFGPRSVFQFCDSLIVAKDCLASPLVYALEASIPAASQDESLRSDVWDVFVASFASYVSGISLAKAWACKCKPFSPRRRKAKAENAKASAQDALAESGEAPNDGEPAD